MNGLPKIVKILEKFEMKQKMNQMKIKWNENHLYFTIQSYGQQVLSTTNRGSMSEYYMN